ncbi:DnaJ-domain-containing protein [Lizonia empirigonia]|nr:DnaJ-domain-containing protein [Lizonia empirigonia]
MGASQSTGGGAAEGQAGGEVKTSYYELLSVERTATQDELKKAYRRKALELHPDRNYGDVERTTALFADVQHAYQVLSDEQERAWYDAHERDILRGGTGEAAGEEQYQGNMKVTTPEEMTRMMGRFRSNVDYTDAPSGFFGFVRETFEQLAKEEEYAADYEYMHIPNYPSFGHKDDTYEGVVRDFYAVWDGFASVKSFAWLDVYRLSDAPDRYTRRLAEKENKKHRDDGRREFNDAVRTLVAFVRKRDPRYTPDTRSAEDKAKAQRELRKAQAARARAEQNAKLEREAQELPSWATERPASELEESEEEIVEEHFECVACNKTFKSERQYEAHEKSKKHQKALKDLKRKMQKDNAHLDLDDYGVSSGIVTPAEDDGEDAADPDTYTIMDDPVEDITTKTEDLELDDTRTDAESEIENTKPTSTETDSPEKPTKTGAADDEDEEDDEYASRSDIESRLADLAPTSASTPQPSTEPPSTEPPSTEAPSAPSPKLGAAAKKRLKKAAKQAETESASADNKCIGCDASFPSKSRLHDHLKSNPKHAAVKTAARPGKRGRGK